MLVYKYIYKCILITGLIFLSLIREFKMISEFVGFWISFSQRTALHWAASYGNMEHVKMLIKQVIGMQTCTE